MTVRGKEMKDVEGTIGMTGKTLFLSFVLRFILLGFPCNFIRAKHVKSPIPDRFMGFILTSLLLAKDFCILCAFV